MSDQPGEPKAEITWSDERTRPGTAVHCPRCGVQVAPGYPKCPKCHAPLPVQASPASRPAPRASSGGGMPGPGGTSAVGGPIAGGPVVWLAIAAGAVVLIVVVLLIARAGGDEAVAVAADAGDPRVADQDEPLADDDELDDLGFTEEDAGPDTSEAAAALLDELRARRLWSNVEAEGRTLVVQSAFCEDPELAEAIEALRATLVAGGVDAVQCYARHGGLELERRLQ